MGGRQRSRRALVIVAGLVPVALLAVPTSAAASKKSKSASLSTNLQVASVKIKCPSGQRANGGGFTATPPVFGGGSSTVAVIESRKSGQRSWVVTGQQHGPGAHTIKGIVYCNTDAPKTTTGSATVLSPVSGGAFSADASCGAGKAQAGGFLTGADAAPRNLILESFRTGKTIWRARAVNNTDSAGHFLTAEVYCAKVKGPRARSGSVTSSSSPALATALSDKCKKGASLSAGGFNQPDTISPTAFYNSLYESFLAGTRWQVSAGVGGSSPRTLTSIAYCA